MGNGDGSFKQRTQYAVEPGGGPYDVQTGDLDRDGKLDLVTTGIDGTAVLRGTGNGTFAAPVYLNDGAAFRVALSDTSGDGLLDLVSINGSTSVSYFTNLGGLAALLQEWNRFCRWQGNCHACCDR